MRNGYDFCYTGYINPRHNKVEINKTIIVYFKSERLKTKFFLCCLFRLCCNEDFNWKKKKTYDGEVG